MASRNPPSGKKDQPVEDRKPPNKQEGDVSPQYATGRKLSWDEEGKYLQTDRDYGSGSRHDKGEVGQDRSAPQIKGKQPAGKPPRESYPSDDEKPLRNNYDGYDSNYPHRH